MVQGVDNLNSSHGDVVSIFILPPSKEELRKRLEGRGTDQQKIVEKRLNNAQNEMSHWHEYDYVLIMMTPIIAIKIYIIY